MDGDEIICPWHAGAYNIMTGKANENTNWVHDTPVYKVTEDPASGELSVEI
jgi:nitrite reductase/ring-hydroxylating ferredoxin subunit